MSYTIESQKFPTLTLPSSAVDNNILNQIEHLVLSVHAELSDELPHLVKQTSKLLSDIQVMRDYINGTDGRKFNLEGL